MAWCHFRRPLSLLFQLTLALHPALTKEELLHFFLEEYAPTPILNPWNSASGFFNNDNTTLWNNLERLTQSDLPRLAHYKEAVAIARKVVEQSIPSLDNSLLKDKRNKTRIQQQYRALVPDALVEWFDAAVTLDREGSQLLNPLLGTGGNEGRLEFSRKFTEMVLSLFVEEHQYLEAHLKNALFGDFTPGLEFASTGQYNPGSAGGYNQGPGIEHKNVPANSWDFLLLMEGTLLFITSIVRGSDVHSSGRASFPFTVFPTTIGFPSAGEIDALKAELWLPLWTRPVSLTELKHIFSEGRATVGRTTAREGLDFARAVSSLGVDRGITGFVRYIIAERRGQSNVAMPSGLVPVRSNPGVRLLGQLDPILRHLFSWISGNLGDTAPATILKAKRNIEKQMYQLCLENTPMVVQHLLVALGQMERIIAQRKQSGLSTTLKPLCGLGQEWIDAADDGSLELELALALHSLYGVEGVGGLSANIAARAPKSPWSWAENSTHFVSLSGSAPRDFSRILKQRVMDAIRLGKSRFPLQGATPASPAALLAFLRNETDDRKLLDLLWGLQLLAPKTQYTLSRTHPPKRELGLVPREFALLKLLFSPEMAKEKKYKLESRIPALLTGNRIEEACTIAQTRLAVMGFSPFKVPLQGWADPLRLCAALLIPMKNSTMLKTYVLNPPKNEEKHV